jgi:hypothetical protein
MAGKLAKSIAVSSGTFLTFAGDEFVSVILLKLSANGAAG